MKMRNDLKIHELKIELNGLESMKKEFEEYLKLGISFLQGVDHFYKNSPSDIKKKITRSIFPEKLTFLGKSYRTKKIDELILLILSKTRRFKPLEIKTPRHFDEVSTVAPQLRLELRTL